MIDLAIKNIIARKVRSILTILGIMVAIQLYIVLSSLMSAYDVDVNKQLSDLVGKIIVQEKRDNGSGVIPLDSVIKEEEAKKVITFDGIDEQRSTLLLYQSVVSAVAPNTPPLVMAVGIEPGKEETYTGKAKYEGEINLKNDTDAILGYNVLKWAQENFSAKLGSTITIKNVNFKIVGTLGKTNALVDSSLIIPLKTAQNIFIRNGSVSCVYVTVLRVKEVDKIAKTISENIPNLYTTTTEEYKKTADEMLASQKFFFSVIENTVVVVAVFIIMVVMIMSVSERKKEIGTLKAIGASGKVIIRMIMYESIILSISGGLIALPVSAIFMIFLNYGVGVNVNTWIKALLVVVILGTVAGIWPAYAAQKVDPLESLRHE